MTYVKICGVTALPQALSALEAGADLMGFVFAASRRQLQEEAAAEIIRSAREAFPPHQRPWQAVGVFANQSLEMVQRIAGRCLLDTAQLSGAEPPEYCRKVGIPVFKTVHVPELPEGRDGPGMEAPAGVRAESVERYLHSVRARTGASRLVLDSGGAGLWGGTGQTFAWERIGNAARDCLVAGGLNPGNVADAILALQPWGVDVSSGVERDGAKDPDLIRLFITQVRRIDNRATY